MNLQRHIRTLLLLTSFAATATLTGCVLSVGTGDDGEGNDDGWNEPCDNGSNNRIDSTGSCVCQFGYDWCTPDSASNDLHCCEINEMIPCDSGSNNHVTPADRCECNTGFEWCDSSDVTNLNCCAIGGSGSQTGEATTSPGTTTDPGTTTTDPGTTGTEGGESGTTGGMDDTGTDGGDEGGEDPDPAQCTAENEGKAFCSKDKDQGPANSKYFVCVAGTWIDDTAALDQICMDAGDDFAFGCVDNPETQSVEVVCGVGPGEVCDPATQANSCIDDAVLEKCVDGRTVHENCDPQNGGSCEVDGVQFEFGNCEVQDGIAGCVCYDEMR